MNATLKPLLERTAGDLMTGEPLVLPQEMPLREAAQALLHLQVEGAPVVDARGKCVGVLSALDFVRLFDVKPHPKPVEHAAQPMTCRFQARLGKADGHDVTLCLLPPGVCPLQCREKNARGSDMLVCREPHAVLTDWQVVELEELPEVPVSHYMTGDPVLVDIDTPIQELAQKMVDAHIHRVVVVDAAERPIGIITGTDVLAAVAFARDE